MLNTTEKGCLTDTLEDTVNELVLQLKRSEGIVDVCRGHNRMRRI